MIGHGPDERWTKRVISRLEDEPRWAERVETGSKRDISGKENEWKRKSTYYEARLGREPY
jgi:hypothetical protein